MFKLTCVSLVAALAISTASLAHADDYGYDAQSAAECSAEFPVFETFSDGSSGCFRTDTPGLQEWAEGEFEVAIAREGHTPTIGLPKTGN